MKSVDWEDKLEMFCMSFVERWPELSVVGSSQDGEQ